MLGFLGSSVGKESACNVGDLDSIPGLGRSPGEGIGYPLQDPCLENSMDSGAWRVAKNQTWQSDFLFHFMSVRFSSVHLLCHIQLFATPWTAAHQASLSITNSWSLLKLMSIKSVMPSNCLILYHPLLLLPSIFPSIRVFSNESALSIWWPKYWSFSFNISPSSEYSELISFRMDWLDLLVVQGTLKSLLQHHSSKASILLHSAFFIVQLSHPYMTAGKIIA